MGDSQVSPRHEVSLEIQEDEDTPVTSNDEDIRQRIRNFTITRIANVLTPFVEHVNNSNISSLSWLANNNNNVENNPPTPNNVSVTIINQNENSLALSVGLHRREENGENNTDTLNDTTVNHNNNENDLNQNRVDRNDTDNNQNNRTVDLNVNEYIPIGLFIFILLLKCMYDHLEGVLTFICMQLAFMFIGDEQTNLRSKSIIRMFVNILLIKMCLEYIFTYDKLPITLIVYNQNFVSPTNIWDLVWIVYMNDCALQFITMSIKLFVKCLPLKILSFKSKLKIYSFIEAISQLYRVIIPTQAWIFYFLNSYQGNDFAMGMILAFVYSILKSFNIVKKLVILDSAVRKFFKRSAVTSLNNEQLAAKGIKCSICLDDFEFPIQLSCQHIFCSGCIQRWSVKKQTCPLCRTMMSEDFASANITSSVFIQLY